MIWSSTQFKAYVDDKKVDDCGISCGSAPLQVAPLARCCIDPSCWLQVSEAEAMVAGGITDVFISNEVVRPDKLRRLVALAMQGDSAACGVAVSATAPAS